MKRYIVTDLKTGNKTEYTSLQWNLAFFACSLIGFIGGILMSNI